MLRAAMWKCGLRQLNPKAFQKFALQEPRAVIQMIILAVPLKIGGSSLWMNWLLVTSVFLCPLISKESYQMGFEHLPSWLGIPLVLMTFLRKVHGTWMFFSSEFWFLKKKIMSWIYPPPRMPVTTRIAFLVGNPISCYCYPGWGVVLSHVEIFPKKLEIFQVSVVFCPSAFAIYAWKQT